MCSCMLLQTDSPGKWWSQGASSRDRSAHAAGSIFQSCPEIKSPFNMKRALQLGIASGSVLMVSHSMWNSHGAALWLQKGFVEHLSTCPRAVLEGEGLHKPKYFMGTLHT